MQLFLKVAFESRRVHNKVHNPKGYELKPDLMMVVHKPSYLVISKYPIYPISYLGDGLAWNADEGRGKLR